MHVGNRAMDHAHAHIAVALRRIDRLRQLDQAQALARQRARLYHQLAPELAPFPVAVVCGVVAKAQKDGQRQADQRERYGRQRDLHREQAAMGQRHQDGQQRVDGQGHANALQHRAPQNQEKPEAGRALANDHCGVQSGKKPILECSIRGSDPRNFGVAFDYPT
ncbi:hypothetical protein D3C71_1698940 [compost metagenome]